jgi:predicted SAM-dependent methyltransferase
MNLKQRIGRWVYAHLPVSHMTFELNRSELRFFRQRFYNAVLPWRRSRIARLRLLHDISVNVGSGGRGKPGWINLDASPYHADIYCTHDIRRPLPFADGAVRRLLAEHVIEHIDFNDDVPRVFAEFHRVLAPGGVARIIVPDAGRYLRAYAHADLQSWRELGLDRDKMPGGMHTPIEMINHVFHQGGEHKFGWDYPTMELALRRAGFSRSVRQSYGVSVDGDLALDQPNHAPYSLYVDAIK